MPRKPYMDWDACKAGLVPALPNNIIVSKHAIQRAHERGIPLSDLYHPSGRHGSGKPIMVGNTVVTAVVNLPNRKPVNPDDEPQPQNTDKETIISINPLVILKGKKFIIYTNCCSMSMRPHMIGAEHKHLEELSAMAENIHIRLGTSSGKFCITGESLEDVVFVCTYMNAEMNLFDICRPEHVQIIQGTLSTQEVTHIQQTYKVMVIPRGKQLYMMAKAKKNLERALKDPVIHMLIKAADKHAQSQSQNH